MSDEPKTPKPSAAGERSGDQHDHDHSEDHEHTLTGRRDHQHTHGAVEPSLLRSDRGMWAVKWSLVGLMFTAVLQVVIVALTGSVALLADTIHNFGDGLTAIPLWIAFRISQRPANKRFTYGYGRAEDLAGLFILLMIFLSAGLAAYESIHRFFEPREIRYLWAVAAASIIGFIGNEVVAQFRIKVGKEIGSASLVADGYHARTDGLTSLAVLAGAIGVGIGFPQADPIAGLVITIAILKILWDSGKTIFMRLLDGVDPEVIDEVRHALNHVDEIQRVEEIRVRWQGHRMLAELNITVDPQLSVAEGHEIAIRAQHQLLHHLDYLSGATIHVNPSGNATEEQHQISEHEHDGHPPHAHQF